MSSKPDIRSVFFKSYYYSHGKYTDLKWKITTIYTVDDKSYALKVSHLFAHLPVCRYFVSAISLQLEYVYKIQNS